MHAFLNYKHGSTLVALEQIKEVDQYRFIMS